MKWKSIIAWIAGIIATLLIILSIAGYFILKSQGFHRYVLAKIVQEGSDATGGRVEVRNFDFHFSTLTAHFYGFTIHGTETSSEKPLLQVDKLTVSLKLLSVLHRRVNFSELLVDHPVINLVINNGNINIPRPRAPTDNSSPTSVFDLAVGHVLLSKGEINYKDRKSALDADVRDLTAETHFSSLNASYAGSISYDDGRIHYAGMAPLAHKLEAQFSATRTALSISSLVFSVGSSRVSLQANVGNYDNPKVDCTYNALVHSQDVSGLTTGTMAAGDVFLTGKLGYQSVSGHQFLRDISLDGQLRSDLLKVVSPQAHVEFRKLSSHYQLANGEFAMRDFATNLLGGQLTAAVSVQDLDTNPATKVHVAMNGISLQAAKASLSNNSAKAVPLIGTLQGVTDASWSGSLRNLQIRSDLDIRGSATAPDGTSPTPVNGAVHISYDAPLNVITVRQTTIRTPHTSILADGHVSNRSNLSIQASTSDLHEVAMFATMLQLNSSTNAKTSQPLNISGAANVTATVRGSLQRPAIDAQVNAQHFMVEGSQWTTLSLTAQGSPSQISIQQGRLISAHQGQISFSGRAELHDWSYLPANQIAFNLSVEQMPATEIEQIARAQYPIDGDLSGEITLHGSQLNPIGNGSLLLTKARIADEPVQNLAVQFKASNGSINSSLNISLPAGAASANLIFIPRTNGYKVEFHAPAILLSRLHTLQEKNLPVNGTLTISASGEGTLDNPNLTAVLQLPQFQLRQNSITGIKADLNIANHRANLTLSSTADQSTIRARATLNMTGDYYTDAAIDTTTIPLEPLLALYVPNHPSGFQGATELHATLKGPLKDMAKMEAHVVIPTLTASYQSLQVGNTTPIRLDYANSIVVLQPAAFKGTESELQFEGRFPIGGSEGMRATAKGSVNLRLLQIFSPDVKSSGTLVLDVNTQGEASDPTVQGQIRLKEASFYTASAPLGLSHANGIFDVAGNQARITQFTGQVGGGEVSAGGTVTFRPQVQFNMSLQAKSVRLLYPEGLRTVLDSDLNLTGSENAATLQGRVLIDSLSFTSDFDISTFMSQFTGPDVPPASATFADAVRLDVSIQSTGELAATSSQVSLQGQANLRAINTLEDPVIVGRADLNSGDVFFLNNRYQLQRGVFTFNNPNQTEPTVNLAATTTIQQYNLTLNVNGSLDKLQTSYVSDPPLSTIDIINLIARGQTTQQSDATNLSANSLLAQGVASRLSSGVQKLAGLSSLSIDPLMNGNNGNPSARIAVQQRITKNFFFTFSTDVTEPQSEIIHGEYQISKRWSVNVNRDASGGIGVDGNFHTNF